MEIDIYGAAEMDPLSPLYKMERPLLDPLHQQISSPMQGAFSPVQSGGSPLLSPSPSHGGILSPYSPRTMSSSSSDDSSRGKKKFHVFFLFSVSFSSFLYWYLRCIVSSKRYVRTVRKLTKTKDWKRKEKIGVHHIFSLLL